MGTLVTVPLPFLSEPCRTMLALVVLTGVRIGELPALRWRVVDFEAGTLPSRPHSISTRTWWTVSTGRRFAPWIACCSQVFPSSMKVEIVGRL